MRTCACVCTCVTWRLGGAGLQGAGLFGHRFGEGVTAPDQLPALVALDVPHPHTHTARLGALRTHGSRQEVLYIIYIYTYISFFSFSDFTEF